MDREEAMQKRGVYTLCKNIINLILVSVFCFYCNIDIACAEGVDIGPYKLSAAIKLQQRYEDNVFLLADNTVSDWISVITPEILFSGKCTQDRLLSLNYKYEMLIFSQVKEKDKRTHDVDFRLESKGLTYYFKIRENFKQIAGPSSYTADYVDYNLNDAQVTFGADYNKFSYELGLEDLDYEYQDIDSPNSYNEAIFGLVGYYKFAPKTKALLEYQHGKILYSIDKTKDAAYDELLIGLDGDITAKISGSAKIGFQLREYRAKEDWKKPVVYIDTVYEVSEKTSLDLGIIRSADESAFTQENYYELNKALLGLQQKITKKTTFSFVPSFEYDIYPATSAIKRKDKIWDITAALDVAARKWLNTGLSYNFKKRDSNVNSDDYQGNITSVYVRAIY